MANPFEAPLERIRACRYVDPDEGKKKYRVAKPASAKVRKAIHTWSSQVPRELEDFMAATAGITGGATCDLRVGFEGGTGPTGVWPIYDYGNGDCLGLEEEGDRCAVWWIGHDPWGIIFVSDSLLAYVNDLADFAEATMDEEEPDDESLWKPRVELAPVTNTDQTVVYDFTGCAPRTHADLFKIPEHARRFDERRQGRKLIAAPRVVPVLAPGVAEAAAKVEQAIAFAMMEDLDRADALLDEALKLDPGHARAVEWKAMVQQRR